MLNNQGSTSVMTCGALPATTRQPTLDFDRSANGHIRELLRLHGLRTSLIRLKVINALVLAKAEERSIGVQGVRACLESSSVKLSLISVREVLKRLAEEGIIVYQADKSYCFTTQAWDMLKPRFDQARLAMAFSLAVQA